MGWLSDPGEAGLEVDENGSTKGAFGALTTGVGVAATVNFSLRFTLTVGGKAGFGPALGTATPDSGVLSSVGLKPEELKEKEEAGGARGEAADVVAWEPLEGVAMEKTGVAEPRAALGLSEPLGYGGGSPGAGAEDFEDEEPKANTAGVPPAEGRLKVTAGTAGTAGGTDGREVGATAPKASSFGRD